MDIKEPFDGDVYERDVAILDHDLNSAFVNQSGMFAHYARRHAAMMQQEGNAKLILGITEATIARELRDEAAKSGAKLTEKAIEQAITLDKRYISATKDYNEAKAMTTLSSAALESFKHRKDMLIQLGASARQEIGMEITMNGARPAAAAAAAAARGARHTDL